MPGPNCIEAFNDVLETVASTATIFSELEPRTGGGTRLPTQERKDARITVVLDASRPRRALVF